eukprot:1036410-Pleurochrysis_carterae.AAC.2
MTPDHALSRHSFTCLMHCSEHEVAESIWHTSCLFWQLMCHMITDSSANLTIALCHSERKRTCEW